jgi:hypothetical protein
MAGYVVRYTSGNNGPFESHAFDTGNDKRDKAAADEWATYVENGEVLGIDDAEILAAQEAAVAEPVNSGSVSTTPDASPVAIERSDLSPALQSSVPVNTEYDPVTGKVKLTYNDGTVTELVATTMASPVTTAL